VGIGVGAGKIPEAKDIEIFTKSRQDGRINPITNIYIYLSSIETEIVLKDRIRREYLQNRD
jgi:hypothetical protein